MTCLFDCDGGMVPVNDEYVAAQMAKLPERMEEDARSALRKLHRESLYPCPSCRPEQYELWRGGHFAPDHSCDECRVRKGKRRTERVAR